MYKYQLDSTTEIPTLVKIHDAMNDTTEIHGAIFFYHVGFVNTMYNNLNL